MKPAGRSTSAALAALLGLGIFVAAVAWPAVALLVETLRDTAQGGERPVDAASLVMAPAPVLVARSVGYGLAVAALALALGWLPGRWIAGGRTARSRTLRAALLLGPACLPPSVMFYAWWQAWPADSALFAWAVRHDAVGTLRRVTLVAALAAWGWPIVAWCTAAAATRLRRATLDALALDGTPAHRRAVVRCRGELPGALAGAFVVGLVVVGHTTAFDLAGVFTAANELRALDAEGAPRSAQLELAAGPIVIALLGAALVTRVLARRALEESADPPRSGAAGTVGLIVAGAVVVAPLALLAARLAERTDLDAYAAIYGGSLLRSLGMAAASALGGCVIGLAALGAACGGAWMQRGAACVRWAWLAAALVPATVVALGLESAYNRPGGSAVYGSVVVVVLGHLARFGFLPAVLGARLAAIEPQVHADLRALDGGHALRGFVAARRPAVLGMLVASGVAVGALALGEIPVTARVHPPSSDPVVVRLLNDMHYQRPQMVVLTVAAFIVAACGVSAAGVLGAMLGRRGRPSRHAVAAAASALLLAATIPGVAGCSERGSGEPLDARISFGTNGTALGQFSYPRAIAVDEARGVAFVVDKTARVQRFALDGTPEIEWRLPAWENGKPTGISVAPDGRVLVADTHYHRVIVYDADGREQLRFGAYGTEPGAFIYPTDVAVGPAGRIYVSEYGGNDRIQVFGPDGSFRFAFGSPGDGAGQLERPQSIEFSADRSELYIVDACNHRIVVTDPEGNVQRVIGGAGSAAGQLLYPYGLDVRPDGTLVVAEFGNHRVQHFAPDGTPRGHYGQLGAGPGQLRYPWGVAGTASELFVLDSGNNRVQVMRAP